MRGVWRLQILWRTLRNRIALANAKWAVRRFPRIREFRRHSLGTELIVSLTSYPARFPLLHLTLRSLLDQTVRPNRTILWIAHDDLMHVPDDVWQLRAYGLEIETCDDIRSYKKLIPALERYPSATIVTADDDLYYSSDWLQLLISAALTHPGSIIATRAHLALLSPDGFLKAYSDWEWETLHSTDCGERCLLFPTSGAGLLLPPGSLWSMATDRQLFERLAPDADDVWIFWMARKHGSEIRKVRGARGLTSWREAQGSSLWKANVLDGGNDTQITRMHTEFGPLPRYGPAPR